MNEYQIKKAVLKLQNESEKNNLEHNIFNAAIEEIRASITSNKMLEKVIESKINKMQLQLDRLFVLLESIEEETEENDNSEKIEEAEEITENLIEESKEIL